MDNIIIKILIPRLVADNAATQGIESAGGAARPTSKVTIVANFVFNIAMAGSLN